MVKLFAVLGMLGAAGALSLCDLCGNSPQTRTGPLASVAYAAPAARPVAVAATAAVAPSGDPETVTLQMIATIKTLGYTAIEVTK